MVRCNNIQSRFGGNTGTFERTCYAAGLMGADGIVAMRFDATEFSPGVTEVLAYGTAVRLSK